MKKQNYAFTKILMVMIVVGCVFSSSMAQSAKIELFEELGGFKPSEMSTNGRFIALFAGTSTDGGVAAVWDRETNTHTNIGISCIAADISNDGVVVGDFPDPDLVMNGRNIIAAGWWKDGVWHGLRGHPNHPIDKLSDGCGSSASAISADGQYIAGYVYVSLKKLVPCVWKRNESGEYVFYKEYTVFAGSLQGGRAWDISDDGQIIAGWNSMSASNSLWKPTIWTDSDVSVTPEIETKQGWLQGINPEGTKAVGVVGNDGIVVGVDGSFKLISVPSRAISSTGMAVTDKGVWTEEIGVWDLIPYLKQFWNIDLDESRYLVNGLNGISGDGKHLTGSFSDLTLRKPVPFSISLLGYPVAIAPNVVNTTLKKVAKEVAITWEKPFYNGYDLIGYNVYKGTEKLNKTLVTTLEFIDKDVMPGTHCYSVTAVYQYDKEVESVKSINSCIEAIGEDGCFSPKHLKSEIVYNKTVNLSWGMPLPNYGSIQPNKSSNVDEPVKLKPTYLKKYQLQTKKELFPASNGSHIYVLNDGDNFYKYTPDGDFVKSFKLGNPGLSPAYTGLTYDSEYFYTGSTLYMGSMGSGTYKLDLENDRQVSYMGVSPVRKKHITYIPTLDDNKGGFEMGTDTSSYFYSKDVKTIIGKGLKNLRDIPGVFGTVHHDGKIYASIQKEGELIIKLFDAMTGELTNEYINLADYANLSFSETAKLGGLTVFKSTEDIMCLVIVVIDGTANTLLFLQLEQMEGLLGYNVYRDGTKLNTSGVLSESIFTEDLTVPGNYEYTVTSLFEGGCESNKSFPANITINPLGTCNTPKEVKAELIRNNVQITWVKPSAVLPHKVIGYNVYRNEVQINEKLITSLFYTDTNLALGEYVYRVDAKYSNSCISEKSEPINASIKGFNVATPPTNMSATVNSSTEATLAWNEPTIGDYAILKWHSGGAEWLTGEENETLSYVACKWDAKDLAMYFDYTLTDVEFYPGANIPHTFYVYVDGVVVAEQHVETVVPNAFNLVTLNTPILVEKGKELMIGYKILSQKGVYPVGADKQKNHSGKGDLISYDGKTWKSLNTDYKVAGNWAISIRLMPYSVEAISQTIAMPEFETCGEGQFGAIEKMSKSDDKSIFVNKEVIGYNIYKGTEKIANIAETTYKTTIDNGSNSCYSVEALFTERRVSEQTTPVCIYGECRSAANLVGTTSTSSVSLSWEAPEMKNVESIELKYHGENNGMGMSFASTFTFHALIQSTAIENLKYDNLTLKSVDALILNDCKVSVVVIQDGKTVYTQDVDKFNIGEIHTFEIANGGFAIDTSKSFLVGLKVTTPAGKATVGLDAGPGISFRGDVLSSDGVALTTLNLMTNGQLNTNWNISANFEQSIPFNEQISGYNVYRDGVKVNTSTIEAIEYEDESVKADTKYEYYVTTLWHTGCESKESNKVAVSTKPDGVEDISADEIRIFPNPAKNKISIRGEYCSLRIYNGAGMMVLENNKNSEQIDVSSLLKGIYIVELLDNDNVINRTMLIITN